MAKIFEVTNEDIKRLTDDQLVDVLFHLLYSEAFANNINKNCISGSLNIKIKDGGDDCSISWQGQPAYTNWLPKNNVMFQCKATIIEPSDCKNEYLTATRTLKPRIRSLFDSSGVYILFNNRDITEMLIESRIAAFKGALTTTGYADIDKCDIRIYDATKIAIWVNEYISIIIRVSALIHKSLPSYIQTWQMLSGYREYGIEYVADDKLNGHITQIRNHFNGPHKTARIVGLSGLGKSRLVFETFRPPDNPEIDFTQQALNESFVYVDASVAENIVGDVINFRNAKYTGILIVDNCEIKLHDNLIKEITHLESKLSLLTLDYNPDISGAEKHTIKLEPVSIDLIKLIIRNCFPGLPEPDVGRIASFSQGFPQIAVLLSNSRLNEEESIGCLNDDVLLTKLLWGNKTEDSAAYKVICGCSIFSHIGFEENMIYQRQFVAENICGVDNEVFYSKVKEFIDRGIIDKRNRFITVTPKPLAVRLAADWWKKCPPEKAIQIFKEQLPPGLTEALCEQISYLNFLPEVKSLTKELCGEQGPFGKAEVLNTEEGSRIFRSFVEVNPIVTAKTLEKVYGNEPLDNIYKVGPGRRNLIWSLEKLCFRLDTFEVAAPILMAFAAAENETWGNNATNQFMQLFRVWNSGTQATPEIRLLIIDDAIRKEQPIFKVISIKALGSSFKMLFQTRLVYAEYQGSSPTLEEWKPKVWSDVYSYWREALMRLTRYAIEDDELSVLARKNISDNLREMIRYNIVADIDYVIITILDKRNIFWPEALESIRSIIKYDLKELDRERIKYLKKWLKLLMPRSTKDRMYYYISVPAYHEYRNLKNGTLIDKAQKKAYYLAEELSNKPDDLLAYLPMLYQGEQRKARDFGFRLGQLIEKPEEIIELTYSIIKDISSKNLNLTFISGFLASVREKNNELAIKTIINIGKITGNVNNIIEVSSLSNPSEEDLQLILILAKENILDLDHLRAYAYGSVLSTHKTSTIIGFCNELMKISIEGTWVALEILFMYNFTNKNKWDECLAINHQIISTPGILSNTDKLINREMYHWQEITSKLLSNTPRDEKLALQVNSEMLAVLSNHHSGLSFDDNLKEIYQLLLETYGDIIWPVIGRVLISGKPTLRENLIECLSSRYRADKKTPISYLDSSIFKAWCATEPDKAPRLLVQIIPIINISENKCSFSDKTQFLIDEYGNDNKVLSGIEFFMGPSSWTGSIIPYYLNHIVALNRLSNHSNPNVRKWALGVIKKRNEQIEHEKKREEEHELGLY